MLLITLAQSGPGNQFWLTIGLLFGVLIVGGIAIFAIRAKLFSADDSIADSTGGGLMEHLDSMLKSGKITQEEYDLTRRSIVEKAVERMGAEPHDQSGGQSDDQSDLAG